MYSLHLKTVASLLVLTALAAPSAHAQAEGVVPAWDARGVGPLPRQGISCLAINDDASAIAVGTIAGPGEPNVFLFDSDGNLVRSAMAGQRWIQQVSIDKTGKILHALCTMPEGKAGDFPTVYSCGKETIAIPSQLGESGWPQNLFHYGAHSNHTGVQLKSFDRGGVAVYGNRVLWLTSNDGKVESQVDFPRAANSATVSLAVTPGGYAVVGCSAERPVDGKAQQNLFLLSPNSKKPIWSRLAMTEVDKVAPPEKGLYGTPTLPDGKREELPQRDVPVFAPLSVAVYGEEEPELIAVADYPGWQRWLHSSATFKDQNYGTRFMPAKPTITVYDRRGNLIKRLGPELFPHAMWVDLGFFEHGKVLIAYPHHWTCRGLAGQSILPADDQQRSVFMINLETGKVNTFEDGQTSDVGISEKLVKFGFWNNGLAQLNQTGPQLVRVSKEGRSVIAYTGGQITVADFGNKKGWQKDLNKLIKPTLKPWVANARATPIGKGVWNLPGGRVESDLGGQNLIEAPDGLILIEGHAGLSFEREWQAIKAVGLDPMKVKYILATHEHGDHAPGAYLWRVATGAKFVCSDVMAYSLQHHLPLSTGYGLHPPVPTDIRVKEDTELDLAGLKVKALRLPGHTFGSMGWYFTIGGKSYVSFGDLIMPDGPLGYSGTVNFSARDVLSSLRKLQALKPDVALPGHGPIGNPDRYIASGIEVGVRVGWGKMRPERPDPYFRITQKNVQVVGWNIDATSADFGDLDGDGKPDIAMVVPEGDGAVVKIFLNKNGQFAQQPDHVIALPKVSGPNKIRVRHLNDDKRADLLVAGKTAAILMSDGAWPNFTTMHLSMGDLNHIHNIDLTGAGKKQLVVGARFGGFHFVRPGKEGAWNLTPMVPDVRGPYADFQMVDVNGDGRTDLVTSTGKIHLRQPDGKIPAKPSLELPLPDPKDWTMLAVGDFNADGRPDVVLFSYGMKEPMAFVHYGTGDKAEPFRRKADAVFEINQGVPKNQTHPLLRDNPVVADWDGDGIADLIIGRGQDNQVLILHGGEQGLDMKRATRINLDYRVHYETGLHVADFNGDGVPDLGCLGYTSTGVGASGPLAAYLWMQGKR